MKLITAAQLLVVAFFTLMAGNLMAAEAPFEGRKKCSSGHKAQVLGKHRPRQCHEIAGTQY